MKKHPEVLSEQQKNLTAWRATFLDVLFFAIFFTILYFACSIAADFSRHLTNELGINKYIAGFICMGLVFGLFIGSFFLKAHHYQTMFGKKK
jgi:TRAP-type C4-dicarboxylate transport system permease small subunit